MREKWRGEENATGVGGSERSNADVGPRGKRRSHLNYRNWPERKRLKSIRETLAEPHVERS